MDFVKYCGTGNDFIVIDNREGQHVMDDVDFWRHTCDRRFGVGADGALFLCRPKEEKNHFKMVYLNADGREVSMCGNGARCLIHFYWSLTGQKTGKLSFETKEGLYFGEVHEDETVTLWMTELFDVDKLKISDLFDAKKSLYLNTGVPHCVFEVGALNDEQIEYAPRIRHDSRFENGVNVNYFCKTSENTLEMRTFERGVEGETLACGTGALAVAVAFTRIYGFKDNVICKTKGGALSIGLNENLSHMTLTGEVKRVFSGTL